MIKVNSDIAYTFIRKKILDGVYRTGQPLMAKELAQEIGVSRTPVRDALRRLEVDGLVTVRTRLGASVKTMSIDEYREMCGMRLALESYAAGQAAETRTPEELREMKYALESMRELTENLTRLKVDDQEVLEQLRRADVRFHIGIISAAKSELLKKEVLRLHLVSRVVSGPAPEARLPTEKPERDRHRKEVQSMHDDIYNAIEAGDPMAAKIATERHIQDIINANIRAMVGQAPVPVARELSEEELSYTG